ncbi:hypothetical protein [Kozakia baliensis]|uniref:hypothetical protein n=1 Tax=Kozakia baliensis TaxID=153496 RepID=UPI00087A08FE|nr:hypothetical protein [Kozakia baliensis]AOX21507.1 hypothetical protein A0U90_13460 [Kozakia baliensis]
MPDNLTKPSGQRTGNYLYPIGLICAAPPGRVQAFERIFPPVAFILALIGAIGFPALTICCFDGLDAIEILIVAALSIFLWLAVCFTCFMLSFNVICQPRMTDYK